MRRTPPSPPRVGSIGGGGGECSRRRPSPFTADSRLRSRAVAALLAVALLPIQSFSLSSCNAMAPPAGAARNGRGGGGGGLVGTAGGTPPPTSSKEPTTTEPRVTASASAVIPPLPRPDPSSPRRARSYGEARRVRALLGHDAAAPLYRELLLEGERRPDRPRDPSAAARMAASYESPRRHDEIFDYSDEEGLEADAASLRELLDDSGYHSTGVHDAFGVSPERWSAGPAFVRPVTAGEVGRRCPFDFREDVGGKGASSTGEGVSCDAASEERRRDRSRNCLIALFLLGFALPRATLSTCLLGSDESVTLLQRLGLVHPCDVDPDLMIPYAQLFPLDVDVAQQPHPMDDDDVEKEEERSSIRRGRHSRSSVVIATDWHPDVLSTATVGRSGDGAVMYVGPDTLALVQHLPPVPSSLESVLDDVNSAPLRILDLCCGSGVQAICALASLGDRRGMPTMPTMPTATDEEDGEKAGEGPPRSSKKHRSVPVAVCVDVNPRAVKFARFNALLNGFEEQVRAVRADLMELERDLVGCPSSTGNIEDHNGRRDGSSLAKLRGALSDLLPLNDDPDDHGGDARGPARVDDKGNSLRFDLILANPPFIPTPSAQGRLPEGSDVRATATDRARSTEAAKDEGDGSVEHPSSPPTSATAADISRRYGLFSDGGSDGEEVLGSIVRSAPALLSPRPGSMLAVVSEFMNPGPDLCRRIEGWWRWRSSPKEVEEEVAGVDGGNAHTAAAAAGLLFTNERPVSADTYASRRAGDRDDDGDVFRIWREHLQDRGITSVSPGLLFVVCRAAADGRSSPRRREEEDADGATTAEIETASQTTSPPHPPASRDGLNLVHSVVPRSGSGSLWTPHNGEAVSFTRAKWRGFVDSLKAM